MSTTEDEARYEEWMDQLYQEHKEQAIEEFTIDRLRSYYVANPFLLKGPFAALRDARSLLDNHPNAAQVFGAIAAEIGLKTGLLKPVVYGLIHTESTAAMIADLALRHTRFDFFRGLLSKIVSDLGGFDLTSYARTGVSKTLLEEIEEVQKCRDHVAHRGASVTCAQAQQAIEVAKVIVEEFVPTVVKRLGLHLHDGQRICSDPRCHLLDR